MSDFPATAPTDLLSAESRAVVGATAEVVADHAEQITAVFYPRMFRERTGWYVGSRRPPT